MPAKWARVQPAILSALSPLPGGTMMMATAAKKHLTLFQRSRTAQGAGSPDVKAAFAAAGKQTLGIADRTERNAIVARAVQGRGSGVYRYRSRAKRGSPLYMKVYESRKA